MLYYIDKSCVELLNSGDPDAAEFMEQLIIHRKRCKNMIAADRNVLRDLSRSEKLAPFAREFYRILANRSSEFKLILSEAKKYYKVVSDYQGDKVAESNGQVVIQLSIKDGNKTDFTDRCILLVESTDDIDFYKLIGKYYLKRNHLNHIDISFEEMIGGGNTTSTRLEKIIDEGRRQCLCIMDSDKKYFGAKDGDTLKRVMEVMDAKGTDDVQLYPLHMHEIENLIPVGLLGEICKDIPSAEDGIKFLEFLLKQDKSSCSPVYYFDYKRGIPRSRFFIKNSEDEKEIKKFRRLEEYRNYWRKYIENFGVEIEKSDADPIIQGVCEKVLTHAIKYLGEDREMEQKIDNSYIQDVWLDLGTVIVMWGCVGKRIAV